MELQFDYIGLNCSLSDPRISRECRNLDDLLFYVWFHIRNALKRNSDQDSSIVDFCEVQDVHELVITVRNPPEDLEERTESLHTRLRRFGLEIQVLDVGVLDNEPEADLAADVAPSEPC